MYMNDINLFAKIENLLHAVRMNKQDTGMEFGIGISAMLLRKSGKRQMTEGIELSNQEIYQNARRKRNLQILGNIEKGHHQTSRGKKKKIRKRIPQEKEKLLETNVYCRNLIKGLLRTILNVDEGRIQKLS